MAQWSEIKSLESQSARGLGSHAQFGTSGSFKNPGEAKGIDFSAVDEEWKSEAFYYFETMAEVNKIINVTARGVSSCELEVGRISSTGSFLHMPDDPEMSQLLLDLEGPCGDYHQIMESMAQNLQITGDGYFIGSPVHEGGRIKSYENWEFVSVDELSITGDHNNRTVRRNASGNVKKYNFHSSEDLSRMGLDEDYYITRCWRRSPRYSQLSTSALKANLKTLKLLSKLDDLMNAITNSQLSSGILIVPEEASFGPEDDLVDGGEMAEDIIDPLTDELIEYLSAAAEDRSSAASLAPIILRIKSDYADKVSMVRLSRDLDVQTSVIREELYRRLTIGLDAPPETLDGKSQLNNWTGYQVDAEFATKHIIPLGHLIANFLTRSYLWPMLAKRIKDGTSTKRIEDIKKYRIAFNPRNIVARIDKATLAMKLFERGILSAEATVRACGFEPSDMPTTNERRQSLIIDLFKASPVTLAPVLLPLIDGLEHLVGLIPLPGEDGRIHERTKGLPSTLPNQDRDARGNGPRRTPVESRGTEPDRSRINDDRGPGGEREDKRRSPDTNMETVAEETQNFVKLLDEIGSIQGNENNIQDAIDRFLSVIGLDAFESMQFSEAVNKTLTLDYNPTEAIRRGMEAVL